MKEEKEIPTLEQVQSMIAKKYGLGEKLVTGHAKKYFDEASIEFAKLHVKKALLEAALNTDRESNIDYHHNIILESYPESNIK